MKLSALYTFLFLLISTQCFSQFRLLPNVASYLNNEQMAKVVVCKDDHTVWGLSATGKVYVKRSADANFALYTPMAGHPVSDLDGYSYNEMYFLEADATIYYVKNGVPTLISLSGVTKINNIAIVHATQNSTLTGYYGNRDWLAAATSTDIHPVFRNDIIGSAPYQPGGVPSPQSDREWRITNSGFKSIDFQYVYATNDACAGAVTHQYYNKVGTNDRKTVLPEQAPPNNVVTCTFFEAPFNEAVDGTTVLTNFWGTMNGLYAKHPDDCSPVKLLDGKSIYDIDEVYQMRDLMNLKFLLVAASDGLYYTSNTLSVSRGFKPMLQFLGLTRFNAITDKVLSIATEIQSEDVLCEKVIWLATANGIKRLTVGIDQEFGAPRELLSFSEPSQDPGLIRYDMCPGREITITANVAADNLSRYQLSWLKDGVEVMALRNKAQVVLTVPATYEFRLTDICSGTVLKQGGMWLRQVDDPEITFKNEGDINICEGGSVTFTTKKPVDNSYTYQWVRNGTDIADANENTYKASLPGVYKVKVGNCLQTFFESEEVRVNVADLSVPVITRSSNRSLCFGETVTLSVPEINGAVYKWNSGETTATIEVKKTGNYKVEIKVGTCSVASDFVSVVVADEIVLDKVPDVKICVLRHDQVKLTAKEGYAFYTWNGQKGTDNEFTVSDAGQYTLEIEDINGCKASTVYVVLPYCAVLAPPNAFSPNGDGTNDLWVVEGLENDPEATIVIYNRFGVQVFSTRGDKPVWDGRSHNGEVQAGVYYYVISSKNVSKPLKGAVSVIK